MSLPIFQQLYDNLYEVPEIKGLNAVIQDGDKVLELGSGLGIITALAARKAGSGRVVSYEANPGMIADTRAFLAANNVTSVDLRPGVLVPEDVAPGATRMFYLHASFAESSLKYTAGKGVEVPATSLPQVMAEFRPDVLLCDIEGAEAELLAGIDASHLRAAVIEFHPAVLNRAEVASIYDAFAKHRLYPAIELSSGTVVVFTKA
ncbi:MAG: FkbM family methyltransferase [Pseudomonadota bacterium]